jgi:hypothetical protein
MLLLASSGLAHAQDEGVIQAGGFGQRPLPRTCCPQPLPCPPGYPYPPGSTPAPPTVTDPAVPMVPGEDPLADRFASAFATQTGQGALAGRSVNEEIDNDNAGIFYRLRIVTGTTIQRQQVGTRQVVVIDPQTGRATIVTIPVFANVPVQTTGTVRVPVAGRYSGVQVMDNDSPRPDDRVYVGHHYYDGLAGSLNSTIGAFQQHRSMVGFEKTFADGTASLGMRLPFIQLTGPAGLGGDSIGDLTVILKYAAYADYNRMNFFTLGFAVTAPTGAPGGVLADGSSIPHSVLLQPWAGIVRSGERAYVQGVTNLIIPTDSRDITLLGNTIAFGYWLYRGNPERRLPAVTPTAEFHLRTPLSNRGPDALVYMPDQVNITSGVHFRWRRAVFSGAVCVPVVGPRPWDVEAIANLNFLF